MPQSLSKVYVHITFSTKNRQPLIDDTIKGSLFEYLGGICNSLDCNPLKVGGYFDPIHVICLLSRKVAQMTLSEELKKQSSKWSKTKSQRYSEFYRQSSYGIFSVNPTETDLVVNSIMNQKEHHKKVSFQDKYRTFLRKYKVEYDEQCVWD